MRLTSWLTRDRKSTTDRHDQTVPPNESDITVEIIALEGRCMKCKEKRTFTPADAVVMKNGAVRVWGPCPKCGSNINTMMSKANAIEKGVDFKES